jgi:hypothetical protein
MTKLYGGRASDPSTTANWRTARAQVTVNGKTYVVPISDVGPSPGQQKKGYVSDLTSDFAKGAGWMSDDSDGPVQIKLLPPGSGPDYLTNRAEWHVEQENIGKQLTPTPLCSSDIVRPPSTKILLCLPVLNRQNQPPKLTPAQAAPCSQILTLMTSLTRHISDQTLNDESPRFRACLGQR